tara:strand:- start:237 stop:629 length:393 start_codon:yes stop_codon:yes gene_type:complete
MVEIQCPHCIEIIDIEDALFGLFECPICGREFEWNNEAISTNEELFNSSDFLIGLCAPALPSSIGIFYAFVIAEGWGTLVWFALSMLIWPVIAIIFLIYAIIKSRKFMIFGTAMSLFLMLILFFVLPIFQ